MRLNLLKALQILIILIGTFSLSSQSLARSYWQFIIENKTTSPLEITNLQKSICQAEGCGEDIKAGDIIPPRATKWFRIGLLDQGAKPRENKIIFQVREKDSSDNFCHYIVDATWGELTIVRQDCSGRLKGNDRDTTDHASSHGYIGIYQ